MNYSKHAVRPIESSLWRNKVTLLPLCTVLEDRRELSDSGADSVAAVTLKTMRLVLLPR